MQYVCRSCLLRLGQSWRLPTRPRPPLRRIPSETSHRAVHGIAPPGDGNVHDLRTGLEEEEEEEEERQPGSDGSMNRSSSSTEAAAGGTPSIPLRFRKVFADRPTISASTFTPNDSRVKYIKKYRRLEDQSPVFARVLHRFGEWEVNQRRRMRSFTEEMEATRFNKWKQDVSDFPDCWEAQAAPTGIQQRQVGWLMACDTVDEILNGWETTRPVYPVLLHLALRYVPSKAHLVLESIFRAPKGLETLRFYHIEDALELLAMRLRSMEPHERPAYAESLANLTVLALHHTRTQYIGRPQIHICQAALHNILEALPVPKLESWYHDICSLDCALFPFTEVAFANRFARSAATKLLAVKVLWRLQGASKIDINSPIAASICTSILTFSHQDYATMDAQSTTPADLFQKLHSMGMIPNVITYTTTIRGLCLRKDLRTALDVWEVMMDHGVEPDAVTYSTLIVGCKECGDFGTLADLANRARAANIRDPRVWNDVLYALYLACLREQKDRLSPPRFPTYPMNALFTRIFNAQPLKPFITGRFVQAGEMTLNNWAPEAFKEVFQYMPPYPPQQLLEPGSDTLSVMLLGVIRSLPMPYDVLLFYVQFKKMVEQGHPVAELLIRERGTIVYDIVIRNLIKWKGTLRVALDIIKDMMRGDAHGDEEAPSQRHSAPAPADSVYSEETPQDTRADAEQPAGSEADSVYSEGIPQDTRADAEQPAGSEADSVYSEEIPQDTRADAEQPAGSEADSVYSEGIPQDTGADAEQPAGSEADSVYSEEIPQDTRADAEQPAGSEGPPPQNAEIGGAAIHAEQPAGSEGPPPQNAEIGGAAIHAPQPDVAEPTSSSSNEYHAVATTSVPRRRIRHPSPSRHTWNILIHAFMQNKLPAKAEHILKIMDQHGIQPNIVTWNTITSGYAKMGNIPKAVEAMRCLESSGFEADDWTMRAFSRIHNKQKAIRLMESAIKENESPELEGSEQQGEASDPIGLAISAAALQQEAQQQPKHGSEQDGSSFDDDEEEEANHLDQDLEAQLLQEPERVLAPEVSKKIYDGIRHMEKVAPATEVPELEAWTRVRKEGFEDVPAPESAANLKLRPFSAAREEGETCSRKEPVHTPAPAGQAI